MAVLNEKVWKIVHFARIALTVLYMDVHRVVGLQIKLAGGSNRER